MNRKMFLSMALVPVLLSSGSSPDGEPAFVWSAPAHIPTPLGLAGVLAGVDHDCMLLAGGTNFPGGMPWEGGKKIYYDDIYILRKDARGFGWVATGKYRLPAAIAYCASVTTPQGVVSIGGENEAGLSTRVLLMRWDAGEKKVIIARLPDLPVALTNASAALLHDRIYVAGGETISGVSDGFYCLEDTGWRVLPSLPKPLSHAVLTAGEAGIYLIGGRKKNRDGISELSSSVYVYGVGDDRWLERQPLPYALSAGTGLAYEEGVLLFGGDKGTVFHQTEKLIAAIAAEKDIVRRDALVLQKSRLQAMHPGFSRDILMYDARKDQWVVTGVIPFPPPVTTTAFRWADKIVIPGGEIRAGIRTSQILIADPVKKDE
jgi:N-acetylneuraminate epimerase